MVMRLMGQVYGYAAATMPMIGQVKTEEKQGSRWVVGDGSDLSFIKWKQMERYLLIEFSE